MASTSTPRGTRRACCTAGMTSGIAGGYCEAWGHGPGWGTFERLRGNGGRRLPRRRLVRRRLSRRPLQAAEPGRRLHAAVRALWRQGRCDALRAGVARGALRLPRPDDLGAARHGAACAQRFDLARLVTDLG